MLTHPTILEMMARSTNDERVGEALRLRAVYMERTRREKGVRVWLARVLLRAALRLDSTAREWAVKDALPAATSD
jgi:hypothetical protein